MQSSVIECPCCGADARLYRREFSEQAWSVLLVWGEVEEQIVDQPICDGCYEELRDVLIERASEVDEALRAPAKVAKAPAKHAVTAAKAGAEAAKATKKTAKTAAKKKTAKKTASKSRRSKKEDKLAS